MKRRKGQNRAVALKYQPELDKAPRVTAMGKGKVAEKIIEIAREHNIHIHNDPDLIEVLSQLDLNEEIPPALYVIVAELLAFVYSLNADDGRRPEVRGQRSEVPPEGRRAGRSQKSEVEWSSGRVVEWERLSAAKIGVGGQSKD